MLIAGKGAASYCLQFEKCLAQLKFGDSKPSVLLLNRVGITGAILSCDTKHRCSGILARGFQEFWVPYLLSECSYCTTRLQWSWLRDANFATSCWPASWAATRCLSPFWQSRRWRRAPWCVSDSASAWASVTAPFSRKPTGYRGYLTGTSRRCWDPRSRLQSQPWRLHSVSQYHSQQVSEG